jgi:hypothetical protein
MRCFQLRGLTAEAEAWRDAHCEREVITVCPHCGKLLDEPEQGEFVIAHEEHVDSFYGAGPTLHTYYSYRALVKEVIQAEPWSSGPVCFLCLELEDGTRIGEWPQEEIDNA